MSIEEFLNSRTKRSKSLSLDLIAKMGIREEYPYCVEHFETNFLALVSAVARNALYVKTNNERFVFENPLFSSATRLSTLSAAKSGLQMRLKDFLASIPAFADFTDSQLANLEQKAQVNKFETGEIIFRQGETGDNFYVINQGAVDVLIQDNYTILARGDLGRIVNRLTEGCYFGERALNTKELRAASIRAIQETICLTFSRAVYEEVISGGTALLGTTGGEVDVDWSKDHETRSLFKHIENILDIEKSEASPKIKRILYELSTAFTPELLPDEIIARMVMTVKVALKVDRVGLFVLSEDQKSMILKVSERSKGVRLPIRGLAGAVLQSNTAINIADAYQDTRFDSTMDRRTGYRTRQVLGVPLKHPLTGVAMGVLQINNKLESHHTNAASTINNAFTTEQQRVLELAAEQLSELLLGRADVFIQSGASTTRSLGQGVGDGMILLNSAEICTPFSINFMNFSLGNSIKEIIFKENLLILELTVSLHLALTTLCSPKKIVLDLPQKGTNNKGIPNINFSLQEKLIFDDIDVRNLPRATRIMVKLAGYKKKKMSEKSRLFLGWTACVAFDFKSCLDGVQTLHFFPFNTPSIPSTNNTPVEEKNNEIEIEVPINTTLSNEGQNTPSTGEITLVLAPDIILPSGEDNLSRDEWITRVRVVHSMPVRTDPFDAETSTSDSLTPAQNDELTRILKLAYNPMSVYIIGEKEKQFLWNVRYMIFNRSNLLPAFVVSIAWNQAEQVQELYDLLDLWSPPSAVEALQLLGKLS